MDTVVYKGRLLSIPRSSSSHLSGGAYKVVQQGGPMITVKYDDARGVVNYEKLEDVVFENLLNGSLDFISICAQYTKTLEMFKNKYEKQISEADYPLMNTILPMKHLKGKPAKDAIYRYLVKYERFKGAPVWEELVKYVEDNNINISGECFRDLYKEEE